MENVSDKDIKKKKKRRKRKKSTTVVSENQIRHEQIVQNHKVKDFDTADLEEIKEEVSKNVSRTKPTPQHIFSVQNLFMTILITCLVVLTIVAGYLIGLFDSLQADDSLDFGNVNSIEMGSSSVSIANYDFLIPMGYTHVSEPNSLMKITDVITGVTFEVSEILTIKNLYSENTIEKYRNKLTSEGYVIYSSYVYEDEYNKYLVYSGVDIVGTELRMVYAPLVDGSVVKIAVTSEFDELTDDIYLSIAEMLGK